MNNCLNCNEEIIKQDFNYEISIPSSVIPRDILKTSVELFRIKEQSYCCEQCFNLGIAKKIIDMAEFEKVQLGDIKFGTDEMRARAEKNNKKLKSFIEYTENI